MGTRPSFSKVRDTSAMDIGPRLSEPAKMTSCISLPRRCLADCSPIVQPIAATTFDFPQTFALTMAVMGSEKTSTVRSQKDLNPLISIFLIRKARASGTLQCMYSHTGETHV